MNDIAEKMFAFYTKLNLELPEALSIKVLNPYKQEKVKRICRQFFNKYYKDNNPRILLLGINPGRLGAGITGISFTDPILLKDNLGIENDFERKPELSATFMHQAINLYGGPEEFYFKFHLSAISPLGFVKNGININYYDDQELFEHTKPFIIESIGQQLEIVQYNKKCLCIGKGKNLEFLYKLNKEKSFFKQIEVVPHPRWVLQYRRKMKDHYLRKYQFIMHKL